MDFVNSGNIGYGTAALPAAVLLREVVRMCEQKIEVIK